MRCVPQAFQCVLGNGNEKIANGIGNNRSETFSGEEEMETFNGVLSIGNCTVH